MSIRKLCISIILAFSPLFIGHSIAEDNSGEPVVDDTYDNTENKTTYDFKDPINVSGEFKEPKEAPEPKEPKGFDD